jgi:tetratricopeptide (TPR) repeat protein
MRLAPTLCALILIGAPANAQPTKSPSKAAAARAKAQPHRERGLKAVAAGRDDDALAAFGLAVEADPKDQVAHHELGKILFRKGQVLESIARFQTAVRLDPKDALAWYNLAYAQRASQKFSEAAQAYRRVIALSPDDADGYYGLAESLRQSGEAREAIAAYEQYLGKEKRESEQRWVQRARERIAELQQQVDSGTPGPAAAQAAAPSVPPATASTSASTPTPTPAPSSATASETRVIVHDVSETPPSQGKMVVGAPVVDVAAKLADGDRAYAAKEFRTALFAYQDAVMADRGNVAARVKAGNAYAKLGHDPEAIDQWNRALALEPANVEAQEALAAAFSRRALRSGTGAPGATPTSTPAPAPTAAPAPAAAPTTTITAVPASTPTGDPAPAVVPSDDAAARQRYSAGVALIHDRKYEAAVAELDQAIALRPAYANALIARGSARISLGRFPEAAQDYAAARSADPSLAAPLFGLAEAYRQMGESAKAIEMYRAFAESTAADAQPNLKAYAKQTAEALSRK